MKTTDALLRGFNLLAISIVALAGFAFAGEIIGETEWAFKIDDILLLLLALVGIAWYLRGKFTQSITPVVLVVLGLLIKIGAIFVEISDTADVGDDFGGVILFLIGSGLVIYQYYQTRKLLAAASTTM